MIKNTFYIEDWEILLVIFKNDYDEEYIMEELWKLNCSKAKEVYINIKIKQENIGFTFTNFYQKKSFILIGLQSNSSQLINTITHEARHLQQHIATFYGLDQNSEEVCYLIGNIVQIIYEICVNNDLL